MNKVSYNKVRNHLGIGRRDFLAAYLTCIFLSNNKNILLRSYLAGGDRREWRKQNIPIDKNLTMWT